MSDVAEGGLECGLAVIRPLINHMQVVVSESGRQTAYLYIYIYIQRERERERERVERDGRPSRRLGGAKTGYISRERESERERGEGGDQVGIKEERKRVGFANDDFVELEKAHFDEHKVHDAADEKEVKSDNDLQARKHDVGGAHTPRLPF